MPFAYFFKLPGLDSNQETSAPEADVLPITPPGNRYTHVVRFALQGETSGFPVSSSLATQNGLAEPLPLIDPAKKHFFARLNT
jgi:hypothetical protein